MLVWKESSLIGCYKSSNSIITTYFWRKNVQKMFMKLTPSWVVVMQMPHNEHVSFTASTRVGIF